MSSHYRACLFSGVPVAVSMADDCDEPATESSPSDAGQSHIKVMCACTSVHAYCGARCCMLCIPSEIAVADFMLLYNLVVPMQLPWGT